jgi:hypothetical protein
MADLAVLFNKLTEARRIILDAHEDVLDERVGPELERALGYLDAARAHVAGVALDEIHKVEMAS